MVQTTQEQAVQAASFLGCEASEHVNPFDLSAIVSSKGFQPMKIVLYGVCRTFSVSVPVFAGHEKYAAASFPSHS